MATIDLCAVGELLDGEARRFDIDGARLCVVKIGDELLCVDDRCSHEDFSLSEGEVLVEECEIECARHGATFDLRTGGACSLPATKPVATHAIRIVGDRVEVEL